MTRKITAILVLALLLCCIPMTAFADDTCSHPNQTLAFTASDHQLYCPDCHTELAPAEPHALVNGECVCGYKSDCGEGNHQTAYDYDRTHHWERCMICWNVIEGTKTTHASPCAICGYHDCYDHNNDCVCDQCGREFHVYSCLFTDETNHSFVCDKCGETESEPHCDENGDKVCDFCEYSMDGSGTVVPPSSEPSSGTSSGSDSRYDNVPRTGDLAVVLMGVSLVTMGAALVLVKKFRTV